MSRLWSLRKRRYLFLSALVFIVMVTSGFILSQVKEVYVIYMNDEKLGAVSNPSVITEWIETEKNLFEEQYPGVKFETNEEGIVATPVQTVRELANDRAVLSSMNQLFRITAIGTEVVIDGKRIGMVNDRETADKVLASYQKLYVPFSEGKEVKALSAGNMQVSSKVRIENVKFVEQVVIKEAPVEPEQIIDGGEMFDRLKGTDTLPVSYSVKEGDCVSCIAQKFSIPQDVIYKNNPWIQNDMISIGDQLDLTIRKPKLSVKTEERYSETVSIPSGVNVTFDAAMRVGTSKVTNPGKQGVKRLHYKVTKVNGAIVEEVVENEELLEKPIPKQVVQGSKVIKGIGTGAFAWPISGPKITSEFGQRWGRLHAGTDTVSSNHDIYASDDGKVSYAGKNSGYGNHIIIDHKNGYKTLYAHLSKINVSEGDVVEKGELIGIMGNTGRSTGTHLHFEIRKDDEQVNPLKYLD